MNRLTQGIIAAIVVVGGYTATNAIYTVSEVEQAIITQFGKPVGEPVTTAGLKIKVPFVQEVNPIDRRVLEWDGNPSRTSFIFPWISSPAGASPIPCNTF
jgi:membrane protease subunit HflC